MYHNARYSVNVKKVRKGTVYSFSKLVFCVLKWIVYSFYVFFLPSKNSSLHRESYKDPIKGKSPEIHLTSSEVRAGSMIESSLLYEHPSRIVEEKCANQVSNFYVGKIFCG